MTEQKYRAVVRTADGRQLYGTLTDIDSAREEITATFTEERVERPVPPTDEPPLVQVGGRRGGKTSALIDALLDRANERGIQVQIIDPHPQTREQVYQAANDVVHDLAVNDAVVYPLEYRERAILDAVLALIQNGADRG